MNQPVDELDFEIQEFEARPTLEKSQTLVEKIDYLMLEEFLTSEDRKQLKGFKSRVTKIDFNKPSNQYLLSQEEIFAKQKKLLYDCEKMGMNAAEELDRQNNQLEDSKSKVYKIDGKLVSSSGLLLTIKRNIQKNTVMLRIVIYTLILVFLVILLMKLFG